MFLRTGKWVLRGQPNFHTLVVVAVFVSLATSFLASAFTDLVGKLLCREIVAASILVVGGWIYLPIISECDAIRRVAEAYHKASGKPFDEVIDGALNESDREDRIRDVGVRVYASVICLIAAILVVSVRAWG